MAIWFSGPMRSFPSLESEADTSRWGDILSWQGTFGPRTTRPGGQLVLGPHVRGDSCCVHSAGPTPNRVAGGHALPSTLGQPSPSSEAFTGGGHQQPRHRDPPSQVLSGSHHSLHLPSQHSLPFLCSPPVSYLSPSISAFCSSPLSFRVFSALSSSSAGSCA